MICEVRIRFTNDYLQAKFGSEAKEDLKKKIKTKGSYIEVPNPDLLLHQDEKGCYVPSEQIEGALANAGKDFKLKSSRKSLNNEIKAKVYIEPDKIYLGADTYDDIKISHPKRKDGSRVTIGHPLFKKGREIEFVIVNNSEDIDSKTMNDVLVKAGNTYGLGARRPKWGKFEVTHFKIMKN